MLPFSEFHQNRSGPRAVSQCSKSPPDSWGLRKVKSVQHASLPVVKSTYGHLLKNVREMFHLGRVFVEGLKSDFAVRRVNQHG